VGPDTTTFCIEEVFIVAKTTPRPKTERTFKTSVDIPANTRAKVIALLNQNLADAFDLMSQSKQAHWNVKGNDFWQLHKLFDELAGEVGEWVDMIAERVTAMGGYATGTARMAAANSTLPEFPTTITDGMAYVQAVSERLAAYSNSARAGIDQTQEWGDANTADMLTEISRCADK
jgi:starvation-inducible DNA-binding protein